MKKTALEKRIKRRITARTHVFFAVCAPGLKRLCYREIKALLPHMEQVTAISGGVEFIGTIQDCYAANLYLRSPSRITMRVAQFKTENFRTLEKWIQQMEWELYLKDGMPFSCDVVTHHCRLYHTDAVARRMETGIIDYFEKLPADRKMVRQGAQASFSQRLLLRGRDDVFELSLDTSGPGLYKRGMKTDVGAAPLRETLASSLLEAAGFLPGMPLVDGMCGSGSFSLEAAMITRNTAPGSFRSFAFEGWPCFSPAQWRYLKNQADKEQLPVDGPSVFASDLDAGCLDALQKTVDAFDFSSTIQVFQSDFFDLKLPDFITTGPGIVVLNPPYGRRIGGNPAAIQSLFQRIGEKLTRDFKGWTAVVIMPDQRLAASFPFSYRWLKLFHGGLDLFVAIGII